LSGSYTIETAPAREPGLHLPQTATGAGPVKAALFGNPGPAGETVEQVYGAEGLARLNRIADLYPTIVTSDNMESCLPELQDLRVIFGTWGLMPLTERHLSRLPRLAAVFYAAGTVKYFAQPLLERGIVVTSSAAANAVPVAEFTVGQILLANKGYFRNVREYRETGDFYGAFAGPGNFRATVSLLGAGQIGRKVIELLRAFHLRVLVFDPFLSAGEAASLGVEKVDIQTAFEEGNVVSNHLADVPETAGMLDGRLFSAMRPDATFINTGRGRTVNQDDLISVFWIRPDLTALLDVTFPEPIPRESVLWSLPNVHITSHIAGSKRDEIGRVAEIAIEEFERWSRGEPLRHAVTAEDLEKGA
jgi:phosphoglycerate dehydrogenase-like enzyme